VNEQISERNLTRAKKKMDDRKLKILDKNIGKPYDEKTMGCLSPAFLLHPELPNYDFILDENYFLPLVEKHTSEIGFDDLISGDLIMLKISDDIHFAIFKSPNLIYHCTKNSKLRLSKIQLYKKYIKKCFRINSS
jgi:hypothetical protein